jgi:hypothetical protein
MSENSSLGFEGVVSLIVLAVVAGALAIHLLPAILRLLWQLVPAVILLWFVVSVLRGIVRKFLE